MKGVVLILASNMAFRSVSSIVHLVAGAVILFGPTQCHANAWKRLFRIHPGGSAVMSRSDIRQWNATTISTGRFYPPQRKQNEHDDYNTLSDLPFLPGIAHRRKTWTRLLGRLFRPPSTPFPTDILVDLITQTGGNLNLCRTIAYGSAVIACGISMCLIHGLRLYDVPLWLEILDELFKVTRPQGCGLLAPFFVIAGYYIYWSILSLRYAFVYYTHEGQWYRQLNLGRHHQIWKDASFWSAQLREMGT